MSSPSILVVDDDRDLANLVERVLREGGYQVAKAYNGNSALALIEQSRPDLILLDILMRDIDGYTVCRAIKMDKKTKDIPVIMLTALRDELNKQLAKDMGADGYMTKPFNSEDLLDTVAKFLKSTS